MKCLVNMLFFEPISMQSLILLSVVGTLYDEKIDHYEKLLRLTFFSFRCHCNGHANKCTKTAGIHKNETRCECEHNTIGVDCDMCHPSYNDAPWQPAGVLDAHPCKGNYD